MSEFQHYDFRRIDKPLSADEKKAINKLSSHIEVSANRAVVSYAYGSFKHEPIDIVEKYFDALLFQASWGQQQLIFRFPQESIDYETIKCFDIDGSDYTGCTSGIEVRRKGGYVLVTIEYDDDSGERGGWIDEDESSLDDFLSLRNDIMNGDYSALYAFWLHIKGLKYENDDDDDYEDEDDDYEIVSPSVPSALGSCSDVLKSFILFWGIDQDVVAAAATFVTPKIAKITDYQSLIKNLVVAEKENWLMRVLDGEALLDIKLKKALEKNQDQSDDANEIKVTYAEVLERLEEVKNKRLKSEKIAADIAYAKRMADIQKKEVQLWILVDTYLETKGGSSYDNAAKTLKDLYDMAMFYKKETEFLSQYKPVFARCQKSQALMGRFMKLKLPMI